MSILLADNGRTEFKIMIPADAGRVLRFAAKELEAYLKKISAADFAIVESAEQSPAPVIRITAEAENPLANDAFTIRARNGMVSIHGANPRAALFGVYDLLETLGCAFVEPGIDCVEKKKRLELGNIDKYSASPFELRNIFRIQIMPDKNAPYRGLEANLHVPQIDWMAKRKLNHYDFYVDYCRYDLWEKYKAPVLGALLDRGFKLEVCHHSIGYFFPSNEAGDYGNYGASTYYATHPEWYHSRQVRIEIPEVRKILMERYLDYVERNPELSMIGLWPGDSGMPPPDETMTVADAYLDFWNRIAAELGQKFPEKRLSGIAYIDLLDPPKKIRGAENMQIWFCPIETNYHYPMTTYAYNAKFLKQLAGWVKMMPAKRVNVFDYYGWQPALIPMARYMQQTIKAYREIGAGGAYCWTGFTYNIMGADYRWAKELYAYANTLWNPDADIAPMEQVWARGVFGSAAGEVMEFFDTLRADHADEAVKGLHRMRPWIKLDLLRKLQQILAGARKTADNPAAMRRIDLLEQVAANASTNKMYRDKAVRGDPLDSV